MSTAELTTHDDKGVTNYQNDEAVQTVPDNKPFSTDKNDESGQIRALVAPAPIFQTDRNYKKGEADYFEDRVKYDHRLGYAGVESNIWEMFSHICFLSGMKIWVVFTCLFTSKDKSTPVVPGTYDEV